jgi:NodT family efflux transporter outer membrane factor (OMF) lipoprotein
MTESTYFSRPALTALCAALALSGCVVGPNYKGPSDVAPTAAAANAFQRAPQAIVNNGPTVANWWDSLHDAQLSALINDAIAHSPDIRVAEARLRQARAGLQQSRANALPNMTAQGIVIDTRSPNTGALQGLLGSQQGQQAQAQQPASTGRGPVQLYDTGFDATWEVDLFGGTKRAIESASAAAEAGEANLADAHVSLAAEVAQAYVGLRDQQLRLVLIRQSAQLQQQMLELSMQRRARGAASDADITQLRAQLESTQATAIPLDAQIAESLDAIAVLCGREPGSLNAQLGAPADLPTLPETVAVGNPAAMIARRPDIRAAERTLAAQSAQVGVKTAARFPKLQLIGSLGFAAGDPGHLLRKDSFTWAGIPYLSWNFLDFGRNKAAVGQAQAALDEADASYRGAVLRALQDAETSLSRYGHQRDNQASVLRQQALTERGSAYVEQRFQVGAANLIDRYDSQRNILSAKQNVVSGEAQLLKDFIALQKSLGLGWEDAAEQIRAAGEPRDKDAVHTPPKEKS